MSDAGEKVDPVSSHDSADLDAGCIECGKPVDRDLPDPIPEGYECMWSEAMSGKALYCHACYGATFTVEIDEDPEGEAAFLCSLGLDPETATIEDLNRVLPPGARAGGKVDP